MGDGGATSDSVAMSDRVAASECVAMSDCGTARRECTTENDSSIVHGAFETIWLATAYFRLVEQSGVNRRKPVLVGGELLVKLSNKQ